jgi:membrane associated rhomboid family serine protease
MIPLKDYNPTRGFPLVNVLLVLANVVLFIADRMTGHVTEVAVKTLKGVVRVEQFVGGFQAFAMVPLDVVSQLPAKWITVFTSMFLHANWLHVGSNMLFLWIFGDNIEDRLGKLRYLSFYLVCGVAAAVSQIVSDPASTLPMVGASGAVAGVMGAYLLLYPRAVVRTLVPIFIFFTFMDLPAFFIIGYWFLLQIVSAVWITGSAPHGGVAYYAHVGGFVAGALLIVPVAIRGRRRRS